MTSPRIARVDTGLPPAPAGTLLVPSEVVGLACHWNGPAVPLPAASGDLDGVRRYLQAIYRQHVGINGWSDVAYQWAADQAGRRWELRGWRRRSAANGDTEPNRHYGAVLAIIGQGQHPTPELLGALADCRADFLRVYPAARALRTHNQVRPEPTACPGPDITRWVAAGGPAPTKEDDMPTPDEVAKAVWSTPIEVPGREGTTPAASLLRWSFAGVIELQGVIDELASRAGVTPAELESIREAVRSQLPELVHVEISAPAAGNPAP